MRIKKGFTLPEILIVLMIIGVIAVLTVPSLMKGVTEAQYKAAYKKAYNAIVNIAAMERIAGQMPQKRNAAQVAMFYGSVANNMNVKEFVKENEIDSGIVLQPGDTKAGFNITSGTTTFHMGSATAREDGLPPTNGRLSSWLVTDDGIAYAMLLAGTDSEVDCDTKQELATRVDATDVATHACAVVVVDVNGLYKGPNRLERQITVAGQFDKPADTVSSSEKMSTLTRDRYYIYIGSDGAIAGPPATTVSGRIINDLK